MSLVPVPVNTAIVGVQKSGTSTLHWLLRQHPAVMRTRQKELHFFDDEELDWERPDYSPYVGWLTAEGQTIAVDATPVYLFWPPVMARMRAYSADMRLMAVFRDPVERAFSHWMMESERNPRARGFDDLITRSLDTGAPQVPPDAFRTPRSRNRSAVARGFYGLQLERGLQHFPSDQWLLLDFLDLAEKQDEVLRRVTDFLGIEPFAEPLSDEQRRRSTPLQDTGPGNPSPAVLERLAAAYADDLRRFGELSGMDTDRWPTVRLLRGELDSEEWATSLRRKARSTSGTPAAGDPVRG